MATPIPGNVARFTSSEVVEVTKGECIAGDVSVVTGVTSDSRDDVRGKAFVALSGERFDGHDFAAEAVRRGAALVLVERDVQVPAGTAVVKVDSTLDALGALARHHRVRWGGKVVGVAGSAGKTTTKSAIAALLETLLPGVVRSVRGNLNNRVGVPMVLLGLLPQHRVAVVEIGTNSPGEVSYLTRTALPDIGVLTLIALEHSEGLGDLDAIEAEESEIYGGLGAQGIAVGNSDDDRVVRRLSSSRGRARIGYGKAAGSTYRLARRRPIGFDGADLEIERPAGAGDRETLVVRSALFGEAGAYAALAALAVGDQLSGPVDAVTASRALGEAGVGESGRLVPVLLPDGGVVLDDSYNANPASVLSSARAAAEAARERGSRLLLVVGEMRELGELSQRAHAEVGAALAETGASLLVALGGDACHMIDPARGAGLIAEFASDAPEALTLLSEHVRPGDVVLVKASRGVRAERVVEGLVARGGSR
jgi:UDP-N-acetylmuramoyl-tripeptide--D-alanyl-D-alanine ligase